MAKASASTDTLSDLLCFSLYSASHAMTRVYKPMLKELGLTYPQYVVMVALWDQDDVLVSEIGERLFLESNTLTPLLKRLEAMGHLTRQRDPEDERRVRVRLSPTGKRLQKKTQSFLQTIAGACGLGESALVRMAHQVAKVRDQLVDTVAQDTD